MKEKIQQEIKKAMKAKEKEKLEVLRGLLADIQTAEAAPKATSPLPEKDILAIFKRGVKRRKEAAEAYRKGKREDLAEKEEKEILFIEPYLPKTLGEAEALKIVQETILELEITDPKKQGLVIKTVLAKYPGQLDGKMVSKLIGQELKKS